MSLLAYRAMERASVDAKHEYVGDQIFLLAGGTRRHSILGLHIAAALIDVLGSGPCEVYNSDMRVRLSEAVLVYPDVSVSCGERDRENGEDDEIAHPILAVEVLSRKPERIDRGRQLRDYQACPSLQEYVLISVEYQAVELYRRAGSGWTYHRYEAGETVEFASTGVRIPIEALYRRTQVPPAPALEVYTQPPMGRPSRL